MIIIIVVLLVSCDMNNNTEQDGFSIEAVGIDTTSRSISRNIDSTGIVFI